MEEVNRSSGIPARLATWFRDVLPFSPREARFVIAAAVIGAAVGTVTGMVIEPQWEASAAYETALIGGGNLESVPEMVEQFRSTAFSDEVVAAAREHGITDEKEQDLLRKSLRKTRSHALVGFVDVRVRAYSRAHALELIGLVVQHMQAIQAERKAPIIEGYRTSLAEVQTTIDTVRRDASRLQDRVEKIAGEKAILAWIMDYTSRQSLLAELHRSEQQLREKALDTANRPGRLLTPAEVSSEPITPRIFALALLGMIAGLALGLTWLQFRR
ncbi:MAG: hypothetical protein NFCOHLIN_02871 [Gammaproteobacteria bacterium]|nr:hypothetical protein [Gammaproteobacteria bacterium]